MSSPNIKTRNIGQYPRYFIRRIRPCSRSDSYRLWRTAELADDRTMHNSYRAIRRCPRRVWVPVGKKKSSGRVANRTNQPTDRPTGFVLQKSFAGGRPIERRAVTCRARPLSSRFARAPVPNPFATGRTHAARPSRAMWPLKRTRLFASVILTWWRRNTSLTTTHIGVWPLH